MTGATGDITPDDPVDPFEPGERGEVEGGDARAAITSTQGRQAPAQAGDTGPPREVKSHQTQAGGDDLTDEPERF